VLAGVLEGVGSADSVIICDFGIGSTGLLTGCTECELENGSVWCAGDGWIWMVTATCMCVCV